MPGAISPPGRGSSPARRSRSHRGDKSPAVWKQSRSSATKILGCRASKETQVSLGESTLDSFEIMGQELELLQQEPQSRDDAESCYEHIKAAGRRARSAERERLRAAREERAQARAKARNLASPMRWSRGTRMMTRSQARSLSPLTGQKERAHSHRVKPKLTEDRSPSPPIQHLEPPVSPRREIKHSMDEPPLSTFGRELQKVAKKDALEAKEDAKALKKIAKAFDTTEQRLYDLNAELYELKAEKVRLEMKLFMNAQENYSFGNHSGIDKPSVPILSGWKVLSNGGVSGTIYFSSNYDDGDLIQTSALAFGGKPQMHDGTLIQTKSGKMYFLDMLYEPPRRMYEI